MKQKKKKKKREVKMCTYNNCDIIAGILEDGMLTGFQSPSLVTVVMYKQSTLFICLFNFKTSGMLCLLICSQHEN